MALSDMTATVVVGKAEYSSLMKKEEQLEIIKRILSNDSMLPIEYINVIKEIVELETSKESEE